MACLINKLGLEYHWYWSISSTGVSLGLEYHGTIVSLVLEYNWDWTITKTLTKSFCYETPPEGKVKTFHSHFSAEDWRFTLQRVAFTREVIIANLE